MSITYASRAQEEGTITVAVTGFNLQNRVASTVSGVVGVVGRLRWDTQLLEHDTVNGQIVIGGGDLLREGDNSRVSVRGVTLMPEEPGTFPFQITRNDNPRVQGSGELILVRLRPRQGVVSGTTRIELAPFVTPSNTLVAMELFPPLPTRTNQLDNVYGATIKMVGRHDEAVVEARLAEERAPLSPAISRRVAWALYMGRRFDEAIAQLERVLATEHGYTPARTLIARAYAMVGRYDDAAAQIEPVHAGGEAIAAQVYAQAGRRAEAMRLLAIAIRPGQVAGNPPYQVAAAYASLPDPDAAVGWMQRAFEVRDPSLVNIAFDPRLDPVRGDARFDELVARMQLQR